MPLVALGLVLVAAATHAVWNLYAKRAAGLHHFVFLYSVGAVLLWAPVVALTPRPAASGTVGLALLGTALLHLAYSVMLQVAYAAADLSLVYPVVRGTGPLLAFVGAVVVLGERPGVQAVAGAAAVVLGVLGLAGGRSNLRAAGLGIATGGFVAGYTLWDAWAVRTVGVPVVWVDYAGNLLRAVLLAPRAWSDRARLRDEWPAAWRPALVVAVLGPLGYILVLSAVQLAPVSHVAPARELSMLVAAWLGGRVLGEADTRRRVLASACVVVGVVLLATSPS